MTKNKSFFSQKNLTRPERNNRREISKKSLYQKKGTVQIWGYEQKRCGPNITRSSIPLSINTA
jgi:hypothetical protein